MKAKYHLTPKRQAIAALGLGRRTVLVLLWECKQQAWKRDSVFSVALLFVYATFKLLFLLALRADSSENTLLFGLEWPFYEIKVRIFV